MNLKFYISVEKRLKLNVRRFWGLILTFVEVIREKLVGGPFCPPSSSRIGLASQCFTISMFIFRFFSTYIKIFCISYNFCCSFVKNIIFFFSKSIIYFVSCLKDSQNFFMQSLRLYTSCLFSMLLNDDVVDNEKPDGICSSTSVVDEFSGLWLRLSVFSIKHSRYAYIINDALSDFWY